MLLPAPDYPLWTAGVSLAGGTPVHYICDESNSWMPDLDDIREKITPNTRALVVTNPNNPTGALYSDELLLGLIEIARQHGLVIFADEVYDKIVYDSKKHTAMAALSEDVLTITFNSLSKSYRSCGYRCGRNLGLVYAASPRLSRYSRGLREPGEILIRFSLYQRM
ncbi:aspartate/methionine/tyrosine aminotransferase [Paraburkholderia sp. WSM4179]|nr:aspartate/methionine/tyrosine aminotransferase [Paraburkholderia sp. WSM4179]